MDKDKDKDKERDKKPGLGVFRVFGQKERQDANADFKRMVEGNADLQDDEKRMIGEILNLGDMSVREIMTPRVDMMLVEDTETVRQALERMRGTGYSRLPVFHEDIDEIVGIVHFKDLVTPLMENRDSEPVSEYLCEALFVPESKDVFPLLAEMQAKRQQMAIVVDEYGGTDGLITMEDIVEEIVGDIADETDRISTMLLNLGEGTWMADGRCSVEDLMELGWPLEESDDYETLAGWLMSKTDTVPKPGESLDFGGFRFKIVAMRRLRISKVYVQRLGDGQDNADDALAGD